VSTGSIPWEQHVAWFERVLDDPNRLLYVVVVDGSDCGTIRFDLEPETRSAYLSIALMLEVRGKGIGTEVIREASRTLSERGGIDQVLAEVRPDNAPSLKAFDRAGYRSVGRRTRDGVVLEVLSFGSEET
jgi:RimJ/RimL family protein N-acetyltransferase